MNKLAQYLDREKLTLEAFGLRIGRSAATVSRLARGVNKPDWKTAEAIERATDGKITISDFREANQAA